MQMVIDHSLSDGDGAKGRKLNFVTFRLAKGIVEQNRLLSGLCIHIKSSHRKEINSRRIGNRKMKENENFECRLMMTADLFSVSINFNL